MPESHEPITPVILPPVTEFAGRWRVVTAAANTLSRAFTWGLIVYIAVSIAPRLSAFVIKSGKPLSPMTELSRIFTNWLNTNLSLVLGLLTLLLLADFFARLQPRRGPLLRCVFVLWHFASLWTPLLFTVLYLNGLLWPLFMD